MPVRRRPRWTGHATDFYGNMHCLDARRMNGTGGTTPNHIYGNPLLVDGKVYVATEDGDAGFRRGQDEATTCQ